MSKTDDSLRDKWASLGIAFNAPDEANANPEQTIIDTIKSGEFPSDRKMFELMLLWMSEYLQLIHVERLKYLLPSLTPFELALMGGIATKCVKNGDFRWRAIIREVQKKLGKNPPRFDAGDDELYLKLKGTDQDFLAFGIKVAPVKPDDHKKLMKRDHTIKKNAWLTNRLFLGPNLRADFITVFTLGIAKNAYQAAKILNCSPNASYRNWHDLEEAKGLGIF
ncbi:MAG: hypothetical protein A2X86_21605 [Bdellovibrionales bacterium GWA2_49_15]|nr:MAG: hypothetical protein A2X86_21605 [Bdellovibrionales bacterium GWA2_49_15]HAZ11563.1 hypothetical protein [Bdellovibrionales bacterium]